MRSDIAGTWDWTYVNLSKNDIKDYISKECITASDDEIKNLVYSFFLMCYEVGLRFLTDYINGDTYFHTSYPEHNLVRARNQFKMVESLEENAEEYEKIVRELSIKK